MRNFIGFMVVLVLCGVATAAEKPRGREEVIGKVREGIERLNKLYWSPALGIWLDLPGDDLRAHYEGRRNPPWWPSANAVEVLLDFMNATGKSEYEASVAALYALRKDPRTRTARMVEELKKRDQWSEADEAKHQLRLQKAAKPAPPATGYYSDFQNEYLDDSGWWGLTWLKMYDRTHDAKYAATARTIHAHMAKNWRPEKGGGIVWCEDEDKQKPNAITNSLFVILSARLYERTKEPAFLSDAEKTLAWFRAAALYDGTAVVDAPGHRGDYWSYNQGTFIGALTAMYQGTKRKEYLDEAVSVADSVLRQSGIVLSDGVIIEKLGISGDGSLFKGVLARYLAQLRDVLRVQNLHPKMVQEIDRCLQASARAILAVNIEADGLYPAAWHEGAQDVTANFNTQVSALAALLAALPEGKP